MSTPNQTTIIGNPNKADHVDEEVSSVPEFEEQPKRPLSQRILAVVWDSLDKPPEERKFIRKVDIWIMSYVCVAYFVKYLDQTNVTNAYVSGMKEDLHMSGQDYNLLQTMFTVGYCLGNLPSQLMMTKVRPSIWLPTVELLWGILVMAMAAAKNVKTLYVLRFFIGMLEASAYPGILTLLGNWYTPQELGKRSAIFIASAQVSQMFSGYLQAGLYAGMDHKHGLRAWQWLFIFDGIIGIPVCIYGYFAVPDSPTNTKARWLKPEDKAMAIGRMERVGRKPPKKLQLKTFKEVFSMWPVYVFSFAFTVHVLGIRVYNYFNIYLKSVGYSVEDANLIPTGAFGFQAVIGLIFAWWSDAVKQRIPMIWIGAVISLIGCIILSVYPEHHRSVMLLGWFLTYAETGASGLIMTMCNEVLSFSAEHRLIVIGVVETSAFVFNAWVILFTYPSGEAPRFKIGYEMAAMFFVLEILAMGVAWYLLRNGKPSLKTAEEAEDESS